MLGYALVFILASHLFANFYIDLSYFGIYALILSIIIFFLNKTIKPLLLFLTMPITGLTLGLFYFAINVFILKLADWILLSHFNLGTNTGNTVKEVFACCEKVTGKNIDLKQMARREGDPASLIADNKKAKEILNWQPEKTLENSIKSAYEWEKVLQNEVLYA